MGPVALGLVYGLESRAWDKEKNSDIIATQMRTCMDSGIMLLRMLWNCDFLVAKKKTGSVNESTTG